MSTPAPLVSVCIPVYNRREYLRQCLGSVVRQTVRDIEIVVSDNASEDDLESVAREFADPRIRYHRQLTNIGATRNHSAAVARATGRYLCMLGSDDLLLPHALATAIDALESHPDASAAIYRYATYSDADCVSPVSDPLPWRGLARALDVGQHRSVFTFTHTTPTALLYRRVALEQLGGLRSDLPAMSDWEIYARMLRRGGGIVFLDRILAIYRVHAESESHTQASNGGFLHDLMTVRRDGYSFGAIFDNEEIWKQISRHLRNGWPLGPLFATIARHGFLAEFIAVAPALALRHAAQRLRKRAAPSLEPDANAAPIDDVVRMTWEQRFAGPIEGSTG